MPKPKILSEATLREFMEAQAARGENYEDGHLWAQAYRSYTRAEVLAEVLDDRVAVGKYGGRAAHSHAKSEEVQ